ncbi:MAG: hypothetical protein ACYC9J_14615 [Sulfuricaulis sp.]
MKYLLKMAVFLLLTGCATAPQAGNLVDVSIVDRTTGQRQVTYRHDGKLYIAGTPGDRYAIILWNKTAGRILTAVSVDAVNVISGETAAPDQTGYVLDPFAETDISGWRKDQYEAAAFYFTALPDSYAARTGRPENVGVIGVAVFPERPLTPRAWIAPESAAPQERQSSDALGTMSQALAKSARKQDLGTGHGERERSEVTFTAFERARDYPDEVIKIFYDSYQNLVACGVIPRLPQREPEPFPVPAHFVPDP